MELSSVLMRTAGANSGTTSSVTLEELSTTMSGRGRGRETLIIFNLDV